MSDIKGSIEATFFIPFHGEECFLNFVDVNHSLKTVARV